MKISDLFIQTFQACVNIFLVITVTISMVMKAPVNLLFGEKMCWILTTGFCFLGNKTVLGGLFMAVNRVLCVMYPNITRNLQTLRKITNQLMVLEWITLVLLVGFHLTRATLTGTDSVIAFCRVF